MKKKTLAWAIKDNETGNLSIETHWTKIRAHQFCQHDQEKIIRVEIKEVVRKK